MKYIFYCLAVLMLAINTLTLSGQANLQKQEDRQEKIDVPELLLTRISVNLKEVPFEQALKTIADKGGFELNYNRSRIPVDTLVSVRIDSLPALDALIKILNDTGTGLRITQTGQFAIIPSKDAIINFHYKPDKRPRGKIKGEVLDGETMTPLRGANVILVNTPLGAVTDAQGKFTITRVPVGSYTVRFSYTGFESLNRTDVIVRPERITFLQAELEMSTIEMESVIITGGYFAEVRDQPTSLVNFSAEEIRRAPGSIGDVSRVVRALPSIAKVDDETNMLMVRGGGPTENIFFIDNIEMPNINHFPIQGTSGGVISLVNVDLIKDVNFYSGGFGAAYGGGLSSVMDLSLR